MNTKILMSFSAILYAGIAVVLLFMPDELVNHLNLERSLPLKILLQFLAAFYFSFGFLNWMTKESKIGGFYNRPIAIANFSHLFIAGLSLFKTLYLNTDFPILLWVWAIVYLILGILFGVLLFRSPV